MFPSRIDSWETQTGINISMINSLGTKSFFFLFLFLVRVIEKDEEIHSKLVSITGDFWRYVKIHIYIYWNTKSLKNKEKTSHSYEIIRRAGMRVCVCVVWEIVFLISFHLQNVKSINKDNQRIRGAARKNKKNYPKRRKKKRE